MSARVNVNVSREPKRVAGFGSQHSPTHRVQLSVSFDIGDGDGTLAALESAVAEARDDIMRAER